MRQTSPARLRTAQGGSARQIVVMLRNLKVTMRWMTPREYARLQGAPDYNLQRGVNQWLTGFGDGVCVPVIEWVDANILSKFYGGLDASPHDALCPATQAQMSLL